MWFVLLTLIHWIVIYPLDSIIQPLNNWGLALVVQRLDNAIHQINHYPVDSVVCFVNTYQLDSDFIRWIAVSSF